MKPTSNELGKPNALEIEQRGAVTVHVEHDAGRLSINGEQLEPTSNPKRWLRPSTESEIVLTDELAESIQ